VIVGGLDFSVNKWMHRATAPIVMGIFAVGIGVVMTSNHALSRSWLECRLLRPKRKSATPIIFERSRLRAPSVGRNEARATSTDLHTMRS
jgi:hypothetical protein